MLRYKKKSKRTGDVGWLPLTGITFPFASFGAWSLLVNTFFLSLAISLPRNAR